MSLKCNFNFATILLLNVLNPLFIILSPFLLFLKVHTDELSKIRVEWVAVDLDILFN